jgi:pimeloyl-ACP methyl ester carboxylesterase
MKHRQFFSYCLLFLSLMMLNGASTHADHSTCKTSGFERWLCKSTKKLDSTGKVVQTSIGPVQYVLKGHGPVVISIHGGFGGWDQGLLIASNLIDEGFSVLAISRPGYLGSAIPPLPPTVEFNAAEQAAVIISVLDALGISQVAALGFSAGAPVAFALAQQYPNRVSAVVLESIGASPSEDSFFYSVLGAFLSLPVFPDYLSYILHLSTKYDFYSTAKEVLGLDTTLTGAALNERIRYVTHHRNQSIFLRKMINASIPITPRLPGILNDFLGINYWTTTFNSSGYVTPTIIVQSINDSNGYYPTAQAVQKQLPPGTQLVTVQESGHIIWLGPQTKSWESQVTSFLKTHSPSSKEH